jgi:hypothetical protein
VALATIDIVHQRDVAPLRQIFLWSA